MNPFPGPRTHKTHKKRLEVVAFMYHGGDGRYQTATKILQNPKALNPHDPYSSMRNPARRTKGFRTWILKESPEKFRGFRGLGFRALGL